MKKSDQVPRFHYGPRPIKGRKGMTKRSYWQKVDPFKNGKPNPDYVNAPIEVTIYFLGKVYKQLCKNGRRRK